MQSPQHIRGAIAAILIASTLPGTSHGMWGATLHPHSMAGYFQQNGVASTFGKFHVPTSVMAGHCITMVSPQYPQGLRDTPASATVVVRVVISKSGAVSPVRLLSGQPQFEIAAMDAVRLWRYRPYMQDGEPLEVTTDLRVEFDPGKPGGLVTHPTQ